VGDDPPKALRRRYWALHRRARSALVGLRESTRLGDQSAERADEGRGWRPGRNGDDDVERDAIGGSHGVFHGRDDDARLLARPPPLERGSYGWVVGDDQQARAAGTGDDVRRPVERRRPKCFRRAAGPRKRGARAERREPSGRAERRQALLLSFAHEHLKARADLLVNLVAEAICAGTGVT
jgi:hypothetical protein